MAVTKIKPIKSTLSKALDYIQNPEKTDGKMLVSSFGCSYETADIEFEYTLSQALDKGSNLAHHLIQSFEPGETTPEQAHEIGRQLADAVTKGQYEYVLTTHIDKGHIHNHIIFCAANFVDHHKYNSNKRTYYGIRNMSDKLCREYGLSVVVPGKGSKGKSYAEYQAEKTGTSWKGKLKIAVDALIPQVADFEELLRRLEAAGYEIKQGKYITPPVWWCVVLLYLIADVPRHFQTAVWGLSSKGFRRHIKARSVSSKLVVKLAYNPLKTPVNQGFFEIIKKF